MKYKLAILFLLSSLTVGPNGWAHPKKHHHKHKKHCGDVYQVRRPSPNSRGAVSAHYCPFSCTTEGIPRQFCRDWREGDICYVEDIRVPVTGAVRSASRYLREDPRRALYRGLVGESIGQRVDRAIESLITGQR